MLSDKLLKILVFTSGMSVMAVEMTGLRLLAPYFGTSLIVTTILIGSMMGFLSLGYSWGGRLGDRSPKLESLARMTLIASIIVIALPFLAQPILKIASSMLKPLLQGETISEPMVAFGTVGAGLLGTIALFAAPVTLMGTVSPWAIRLTVEDVESSGQAAGKLYALSTYGSILGSFLPALVLVPVLGVRNTFIGVGALLLGLSLLCMWKSAKAAGPTAIAVGMAFLPASDIRPADGILYESESIYHFIQVIEEPYSPCKKARHLYLNEGVGVHSVKCTEEDVDMRGVWNYMASAPHFHKDSEEIEDILLIGLAGGTIGRQVLESFPKINIDGVEIDGEVVEVGRKYFDNNHPQINPIVMDGRIFLQNTDRKYDVIMMDAYRQPYIPFHLVTEEFFQQVDSHLNENGLVVINVASVRGVSRKLAAMIYRTLMEVFPWATLVDATQSNDVIIASKSPLSEKDINNAILSIRQNKSKPSLQRVASVLRNKIKGPVDGWEDATLLTDDQAPVEMAWDLMAIEYAQ